MTQEKARAARWKAVAKGYRALAVEAIASKAARDEQLLEALKALEAGRKYTAWMETMAAIQSRRGRPPKNALGTLRGRIKRPAWRPKKWTRETLSELWTWVQEYRAKYGENLRVAAEARAACELYARTGEWPELGSPELAKRTKYWQDVISRARTYAR